ncbi:MAG: hypothetical protein ACQESJ_08425, partial [Bacteroidota bacterium]
KHLQMIFKRILYYNLLTVFLILGVSSIYAQNPIPTSSLTSEDREDLEELTNLMHKSEDFEEKAKEIYEKIDKLKKEEELTDESEKVKKLRKKAMKKDIQAFEKQKEAHKIRYDLYQRHVKKFKESSDTSEMDAIEAKLLMEDADQFFYKASTLRNEAYNQTSELEKKFEKLEKANNIETLGIEKVEKALESYYEKEEENLSDESQKQSGKLPSIDNEKVVVNRKLLRNIRQTTQKVKDYTFRDKFKNIEEKDTVDGEKLIDLWYAYLYSDKSIQTSEAGEEDTISDDEMAENTESEEDLAKETAKDKKKEEKEEEDTIQKDDVSDEQTAEKVKGEEEKGEDTQKPDKQKVSEKKKFSSETVFKIQIAADEKPLSQSTLRKLYDGQKKEISRVVENGWYKYSVGDFETFDQAEDFKEKLNTRDAFIVAYENEKRVNPERSERKEVAGAEETKPEEKVEKVSGSTSEVVFKLQIAASRHPMKENLLKQRYNGTMEINKDKVGGWHKYSIGEFSNYQEANNHKKQIDAEGAFVTAYKDGELLDIKNAIQLSEGKEPVKSPRKRSRKIPAGLTFKVQIAADRIQLDDDRLSDIYSGAKKIQTDQGDGWYRYSIGTCPSYFHAKQLRRKTNVRGAFVVAYKNEERLNAYKLRPSRVHCPDLNVTEFNGNNDQLIFSVQIAASSHSLNSDDLKFIYCGNKTIHEHHIDKWYKYAVGSFDSYEKAAELKKTICVPGAFVVAYEGTDQLDIKQAINK